ncbi:CaiB/BaiF CoA transferase family protein [Salinactinospora qingdaonensis]|uniref:CoA transferase n=1 Tax=Salinactinospora qingdaonensis TaxID=702744 RepID=A0ABP7FJQ9_9ACTN
MSSPTGPQPPSPPPAPSPVESAKALRDLVVLDVATLFAGPMAATMLGDFGAEVIKVEHPEKGDPVRTHGASKDGKGLWWKMLSRNKSAVALYLGSESGQEAFKHMVAGADVVIENFRPGTLERWGLGYDTLSAVNPGIILARVTGFGQYGPYAGRPGFGTLAEAMSGFAAITGEPDGPPTLPPFGLADGIAALTTAYAVMTAVHARQHTGRGQEIDLAITEPILSVLGAQPTVYDQLGTVQQRQGNRSSNNAPRNTYRTADGTWVAVSTSAQSVAERVMTLVGRPDLAQQPWFATGADRARHADELDEAVGAWIARHNRDEVIAAFEKAQAAVAPIYDVRDIMTDPQFAARDTITTVDDPDFGPLRMQNVLFGLSETPGAIRHTGPELGAHTREVLARFGVAPELIARITGERE